MMRVLLILLALVVAVLAFVLDAAWLYWLAGGLVGVAAAAVGFWAWRAYRDRTQFQQSKGSAEKPRDRELDELGIVEVRPQTDDKPVADVADREGDSAGEDEGPAPSPDEAAPERDAAPVADGETASHAGSPATPSTSAAAAVEAQPADAASGDELVQPYVQALRAAVGAHTAAFIVQEEMALEYRVEGVASQSDHARHGTFTTAEPLLTAAMSREAIAVRPVGDAVARESLGYYDEPPDAIGQLATAPVERPSSAAAHFLVVDATSATADLDDHRAQALITRFADLLGFMLEDDAEDAAPDAADTDAWAEVARGEDAPDEPRPRREIIAEEIGRAEQEGHALALALVHLNRAEALARDGQAVVAQAEETLEARLDRLATESRVERFGELTYGLFYTGDPSDVEPWAEAIHTEMGRATGVLEGGVSIGVALMGDRHRDQPEDLRAEATEALRVAYETGTCTIVE